MSTIIENVATKKIHFTRENTMSHDWQVVGVA